MKTLRGVFVNLDSAERACRQLEAIGISQDHLSLTLDEHCPACAYEQARLSQGPSGSLPVGQGLGVALGITIGIIAVFWPITERAAPDPMALNLFDWMLRLFIIASWGLSGAILGGMFAAVTSEAWNALMRRDPDRPQHSHYILSVEFPKDQEPEVRALIQKQGGRLVEAPAAMPL